MAARRWRTVDALHKAIVGKRPVTGFANDSPVSGLRRRSVGTSDVLAQSVAAIAPAGVLVMYPYSITRAAGDSAYIALAITVTVMIMLAITINQFSSRFASTGSIYTAVIRGSGVVPGIVAGVTLAIGYFSIATVTLMSSARNVQDILDRHGVVEGPSPLIRASLIAILGGVIILSLLGGIRLTTRSLLVIEVISVAGVLALTLLILHASGWQFAALLPDQLSDVTPQTVLPGVAVAIVAFVGFESGTSLGAETKRPLVTTPRAVLWTVIVVAGVYLFGAAAQMSSYRVLSAQGADVSPSLPALADSLGYPGLETVINVVVALSYFACALATTNALARLLFAGSREGLLPRALGRTSQRFGTPIVAAALSAGIVTLLPAGSLLITGSVSAIRGFLSPGSTVGYVTAYLLVAISAPLFLRRIGEFTIRSAIPAAGATVILAATLGYKVFELAQERSAGSLVLLLVVCAATAACLIRIRLRPDIRKMLGVYAVPTADETIGGASGKAED